jgi:hypothetical protein
MRFFGFALLLFKMISSRSAKGVSIKTLELYVLVFVFRLASILRHQGYLPYDKTGDWFYHSVEILSLATVVVTLIAAFVPFMSSYQESFDKFGSLLVPSVLGALWLVIPCVVLGFLVHPYVYIYIDLSVVATRL